MRFFLGVCGNGKVKTLPYLRPDRFSLWLAEAYLASLGLPNAQVEWHGVDLVWMAGVDAGVVL